MDFAALLPFSFTFDDLGKGVAYVVPIFTVFGLLSALDAVLHARTPQGSMGWAVALVAFPLAAVPLYWFFGRTQFSEYVKDMRVIDARIEKVLADERSSVLARHMQPDDAADGRGERAAFRELASFPFTRGNGAQLLVDGEETFPALSMLSQRPSSTSSFSSTSCATTRSGSASRRPSWNGPRGRAGVRALRRHRQLRPVAPLPPRTARGGRRGVGLPRPPVRPAPLPRQLPQPPQDRRGGRHRGLLRRASTSATSTSTSTRSSRRGATRTCAWRGRWCKACSSRSSRTGTSPPGHVPKGLVWEATPCVDDRTGLVLASGPAGDLETCSLLFAHAIA